MDTDNTPDAWERAYEHGNDGWDLGGPAPIFVQLAASGRFAPGEMIVLGAGRGHDARIWARHGFTVTAVDFTEYAAREMQRLADPAAPIAIQQADIFTLPNTHDNVFDYVLEHTCFCAIDPQRRDAYADLVARLLKPGGLYIDLAFPLGTHIGGPPFAVATLEIVALMKSRGLALLSREAPLASIPQRVGCEELLVFQKTSEP